MSDGDLIAKMAFAYVGDRTTRVSLVGLQDALNVARMHITEESEAEITRLRECCKGCKGQVEAGAAEIERLKADYAVIRKTLDERWEADKKAAKAIFAATGRTKGFPPNKEIVAYYIAEIERLRTERDDALELLTIAHLQGAYASLEHVASLVANNTRLKEALEKSDLALNDWMVTYASEMASSEQVEESTNRIKNSGGRLAYVAFIRAENRDALASVTGTEGEGK